MADVTDLISRPRRSGPSADADGAGSPLAVTASLAGLRAGLGPLLLCAGLAVVGWFAADAGAHGTTRDALRVGADAWLLGLGAGLDLGGASIGVVPLGITAIALLGAWRAGRRLGGRPEVDARTLPLAVGLLVLAHTVLACVVAVVASTADARTDPALAVVGGLLVGLVGGGGGVVAGAGQGAALLARLPEPARAPVGRAAEVAAVTALLVLTASALLVATAWLLSFGSAANVLAALELTTPDLVALTAVLVLLVPNLLVLGAAYLLGPGFAVGVDTSIAVGSVDLGPVPALPVFAALPEPGDQPAALGALVAVPALCALLAVVLLGRRRPPLGWEGALAAGIGGGAVAGLGLGVLAALGSGSLGAGTMAEFGPPAGSVAVISCVALGLGGGLGAVVVTWWQGRRAESAAR